MFRDFAGEQSPGEEAAGVVARFEIDEGVSIESRFSKLHEAFLYIVLFADNSISFEHMVLKVEPTYPFAFTCAAFLTLTPRLFLPRERVS